MRGVGPIVGSLALAALLAAGCAEKRSARCEAVCQREADCAERLDDDTVNKGECVAECNKLEREKHGADLVTRHVACVSAAKTCRDVRACP